MTEKMIIFLRFLEIAICFPGIVGCGIWWQRFHPCYIDNQAGKMSHKNSRRGLRLKASTNHASRLPKEPSTVQLRRSSARHRTGRCAGARLADKMVRLSYLFPGLTC
jgi:hypothetical protein